MLEWQLLLETISYGGHAEFQRELAKGKYQTQFVAHVTTSSTRSLSLIPLKSVIYQDLVNFKILATIWPNSHPIILWI